MTKQTDWGKRFPAREPLDEILSHWFDSKGLTEHGTSIYGSWLSGYGQDVYNVLAGFMKEESPPKKQRTSNIPPGFNDDGEYIGY